ncbi:MAG: hypothetical protein KAJ19_10725, partial [Gammaproteobacteria bacterium]|nr:hypothetical protein [Gammaproteobacteria bacterium]
KRANDVVGDYRTFNKPQIFQGAGMPAGLFTTWVWNFLSRVYGDLEGGRNLAAGVQAGVHTFLFGTEALPGYEHAVNNFTTSYDGTQNIVDVMERTYGSDATEFLTNGLLGTLMQSAVGSRGNVTMPALFTATSIEEAVPAVRTVADLTRGVGEIAGSIYARGGVDWAAMQEIISLYGVNGAIRNVANTSQGYSIDRRGQLISSEMRDFGSLFSHTLELKTLKERKVQRELARDRNRTEMQAAVRNRLHKGLRTMIRSGDMDADDLDNLLSDAYRSGVTGRDLRRIIKADALVSTIDVNSRELLKALGANQDAGRIMRLYNIEADSYE